MSYSHHATKKSLSITWSDGTTKTISASDKNYMKAMKAISANVSEDVLRAKLNDLRTISAWSGGAVVADDNAVYCKMQDGKLVEVDASLVPTLMEYVQNDWPVQSFCRFIYRLMQNPSRNSIATLYTYASRYGLTLTNDGMIRGYKAINNNWTDKHTGRVDNSIGAKPVMPRNKVCDDPDKACSYG